MKGTLHLLVYNLLELIPDLSTLVSGLGGLSAELERDHVSLDLPEGSFALLRERECILYSRNHSFMSIICGTV